MKTMCYAAERWARAQRAGKASAKAVLIELAWRRNPEDGKCYPSIETLAESLEMDRKTVMGATAYLEKSGLITKRVAWDGRKKLVFYDFPSFNPAEWPVKGAETGSTKSGSTEIGSTKNGIYQEVSTESGTYGGTENGTCGGTENGTGTLNKNTKVEHEKIAIAPSPDLTLSSSSGQPESKVKNSRRKSMTPCPWNEGTPIPEDLKAWASANYPTIDASEEFERFVRWSLSKDMRYARWDQAFRNWCGNALKYQSQRAGNSRPIKRDTTRFAHEWPQEKRQYITPEKQAEIDEYMRKKRLREEAEKAKVA